MSSLPSTMKAITIEGNKARVLDDHPLPKLRPSYVLVKVNSIALNPTDWKHVARKMASPNGLSGCDYAGTVVQVGDSVTKSFNPSDRICGTAHGANFSEPYDGVFANYAMVKGDVQMHTPSSLSDEQAATFPLGIATVMQGLYQKALKLALPTSPTSSNDYVLIYGGSTATGSLGIQYARLSGYRVITTCSSHNFDFVKSLGVEHVFDYKDSDCGKQINKLTDNKLKYAWDTVSVESSAAICAAALSTDPGSKYGTILPVKSPRDDVEVTSTFMYTIFGETFEKGGREMKAEQSDFEYAKMFMEMSEALLRDGKLKTHPEKVGKDGLVGALQGMKEMQEGKVSGTKLVYNVADTPSGSHAEVELNMP